MFLLAAALGQANPSASPVPEPSPSQPVSADQENPHKAKALLDQTILALGGSLYLTSTDKIEEGRFYTLYHGVTNSAGIPYGHFTKFPDKDRFEVIHERSYHILYWTVGNVPVKDKQDLVLIHNGNKGYEITYKGTREEDPKDLTDYLRRRQYSLDWVLRKWLNEPGVALFYVGPAVTEQKQTEQVTIMTSRNQAVTLYLDVNTHLPVKKSFSWRDPTDKLRNFEDEVYDNYRPVQGIVTPFSITRFYNGEMSNQRFLNSVSYNQGVDDAKFAASVSYDPNKPLPKK
jgi:hypothetical protein